MSTATEHEFLYREPEEMQKFRNPPIGSTVQWYPYADPSLSQSQVTAGIVTGHEGQGIIAMTLFGRNHNPRFMFGVRHNSDPFHRDKRETTMKNGGWDFLPPYNPPRMAGSPVQPEPRKATSSTKDKD